MLYRNMNKKNHENAEDFFFLMTLSFWYSIVSITKISAECKFSLTITRSLFCSNLLTCTGVQKYSLLNM